MLNRGRWFRTCLKVIVPVAAVALGLFGLAIAAPAGAQPLRAQTSPIHHVVLLYLENHSFDSVLGYWCNKHPGRCPLGGRPSGGGMPSSVTLSNGAVVTPGVTPDVVPDVDHSVKGQQLAIDGGKMDGWWKISGCTPSTHYACISGYRPSQIPNAARLATKFAISDETFSMADSPSWGGHLYAVAASLDGFTGDNPVPAAGVTAHAGWGCNSDKVTQWVPKGGAAQVIPSCIPDYSIGQQNGGAFEPTPASHMPTIMDRLHANGLSWRIYGQNTQPSGSGGVAKGYGWDICPSFAECLDTKQITNNLPVPMFIKNANAGKLASFSVVTPGGTATADSEHNGFSMTAGDDWVGQIASAIMNGPEWKSTALFITWDDCGCFYDQVPPGSNPDGTPRGPRSPLIIVSPFARRGFTDTKTTTFAGILAFVERTFGLSPLGTNDANAYPFTNAFNFAQAPLAPVPMLTRPVPPGEHINMKEASQDS
jgi:phospholipase C